MRTSLPERQPAGSRCSAPTSLASRIPDALGLGKHTVRLGSLKQCLSWIINCWFPFQALVGPSPSPAQASYPSVCPGLCLVPQFSHSAQVSGTTDGTLGPPHQCRLGCDSWPQPGDAQPFAPSELPSPVERGAGRRAARTLPGRDRPGWNAGPWRGNRGGREALTVGSLVCSTVSDPGSSSWW